MANISVVPSKKNVFGYPESEISIPLKHFKLSSMFFLIVFNELIAVFPVPA